MERKFIRYQSILITAGWGTMILGLCPVLQALVFFLLSPDAVASYVAEYNLSESDYSSLMLFNFVFVFGALACHILSGFFAVRESKGKKVSFACIIFGVLTLIATIYNAYQFYFYEELDFIADYVWFHSIIYFFLLFVNIQLLVSAIYLIVYRRKQNKARARTVQP